MFGVFLRPSLLFLIDINADISLERNKVPLPGSKTAQKVFHENVRKEYLALAKKKNAIVIGNDASFHTSIDEIVASIQNWKALNAVKRIALCGLDGSGKTTLADTLCDYARTLNIPCKVVHFYQEPILLKLMWRMGFWKAGPPSKLVGPKNTRRKPFLWAFLHFADSMIQYFYFTFRYPKRLIIFDRFFHDFFVSFDYFNVRWRGVFEYFLPRLDRTFFIHTDPKEAYIRKPENIKEFFEFGHRKYQELVPRFNMVEVKTGTKSPFVLRDEVIRKLPYAL